MKLTRELNVRISFDIIDQFTWSLTPGPFGGFPDISKLGKPSDEIVNMFLEKVGLSSTAGSVFGKTGEGHIRLSYAMIEKKIILKAMEKLKNFVKELNYKKTREY